MVDLCQRLKGVVDRLGGQISAVLWKSQRDAGSLSRPLLLSEDSADVIPPTGLLAFIGRSVSKW